MAVTREQARALALAAARKRKAEAEQQSAAPQAETEPKKRPLFPSSVGQFVDEVGRAAALTGRTVANVAAGIPLMAADFGVAVRNVGENALDGRPLLEKTRELPSEMFQRGMTEAGVPEHETTTERVADFAGQVALGSRLPVPSVRNPAPVPVPGPRPPSRADQVIATGEQHNVPVFFDDVTDSAAAKRLAVAAEPLGIVGTGSRRATQAAAAQGAASRVVASRVPSVGDDVPALIQQGLKTKLDQFRTTAGRLYDRVASELDPVGTVARSGFEATIKNAEQAQVARGSLADPRLSALIEKYAKAPQGNFSAMRAMRSDLADDISDFYSGANATIGAKGVRLLQEMKSALEKDMEAFARASGDRAYNAWRMADGFYRANIVPFREAGFRDLANTAEPEKAWRYLLAQGGVQSRAVRMYRSLDENGRGAVRYGMVKDARDNATNPNGSFSPAKFAKYLEDHENVVNEFFKGSELREIKGFQNLMRHIERAGQYAENPPTGQRLIPYLMGGAAFTGPLAAKAMLGIGATGMTVKVLFQTKNGRNLLMAMSRAKEGSPAADRLARRMQGLIIAASSADTSFQTNDREEAQQR